MREIRGWTVGQVVTAANMIQNTANLQMLDKNPSSDLLPCIYNGLTLQSQSGSQNSIVTFNSGVARCRDLPTAVYTYLPQNIYGNAYPCFIDISTLDSNNTITLATSPSSGYIVATFSISPTTSSQPVYTITGSLAQIATGSYDPAIHVKLCAYTYTGSTFDLDFTPGTNRDYDAIGSGAIQYDYQTNHVQIGAPSGLSATLLKILSGLDVEISENLQVDKILSIRAANLLKFFNSTNTNFVAFQPGTLAGNTTWTLPTADGTSGQAWITNGSGVLSFGTPLKIANVAANDSNVVFTSSSNRYQECNPTANRTYTLPTTGIGAGEYWEFINRSGFNITIQSSGSNTVYILNAGGSVVLTSVIATPTAAADWKIVSYKYPTITGPVVVTLGGGFSPTNLSGTTTNTPGNSVQRNPTDMRITISSVSSGTTTFTFANVGNYLMTLTGIMENSVGTYTNAGFTFTMGGTGTNLALRNIMQAFGVPNSNYFTASWPAPIEITSANQTVTVNMTGFVTGSGSTSNFTFYGQAIIQALYL